MNTHKFIYKILTILTGTVLYFGMVSGSFAETYYVDPQTGNINNNGGSTSPWSTLQDEPVSVANRKPGAQPRGGQYGNIPEGAWAI